MERWLEGDPRRRGALLRARAAMLQSEVAVALGPRFDPDAFLPAGAADSAAPARRAPGKPPACR